MDDGLKQRLVGAIVLVALAVIFLPQLFDQETPYQVVKEPIPEPPVALTEPAYIEQQRQRVAERQAELASNSDQQQNTQSAIDEQEPVELVVNEAEQPKEPVTEVVPNQPIKTVDAQGDKADKAIAVAQQTIPSLDEQGVPIAWTLQLATFGNQANADKLLNELRSAGYKAYSRQVARDQNSLTRVFVGPSLSKDSVILQQQSIAKRWSLPGLVMRFKP
ncbi:SPOR domain-containing protein [Spartinivicinus ruber]|uniref:SPOR domain-containing protein n=1 Tax=Spartinivicinus ruber TaxID=2683272 RepID=UPI0013D841BD|nr:SPOR domain-containing protein [Spartinivicinus ruber]